VILSIDLGNACGWAVLSNEGKRRDSGTWDVSLRKATKTRPADHPAARWIAMRAQCSVALKKWRPECIVYERGIVFGMRGRAENIVVHGGLRAQLEVAAFDFDDSLPIVAMSPSEWKHGVGLHGNADKPTYIRGANDAFHLNFATARPSDIKRHENEAAALLIGLAAIRLGKVPS
jgi:hypothetical protein